LGSQNVLGVNEPVLIVRPDDGLIGPKHVALYVLLMVIVDVLDENILCLNMEHTGTNKVNVMCGLMYVALFCGQLYFSDE